MNAFSTALHGAISDQDVINVITSHAAPAVVPTLAVAMNRMPYPDPTETLAAAAAAGYDMMSLRGEDSSQHHLAQPPLSPRLHSLPDNVLSPLGLLAEASLQNTDGKKTPFGLGGSHRPSPLTLGEVARIGMTRKGSGMSSTWQAATSDIRGDGIGEDQKISEEMGRGVASQNYFKPGTLSFLFLFGVKLRLRRSWRVRCPYEPR